MRSLLDEVKNWYVIRGDEHLKMGSWEDAIELAKVSDKPCNVMSEQFYKQCYEESIEKV